MKVKIQTMLGDIVVLRRAKRQSRARLYDERADRPVDDIEMRISVIE